MPITVYILGLIVFAMTTSEFMVAGMMSELSAQFGVSIAMIGYLVAAYAGAMTIGGPLLAIGLSKTSKKKALMLLVIIFIVGQTLGALAWNYESMFVARILTGISASAAFGIAISICSDLVPIQLRGRAASVVLSGAMLSNIAGLPLATAITQLWDWRASFWIVDGFVLLSGIVSFTLIPVLAASATQAGSEWSSFRNKSLWAAYMTSMFIIGATFAAFSYFGPILTGLSGFAASTVPWLLVLYGAATVVGNLVVGRLADRYTYPVLIGGLLLLVIGLLAFALFGHQQMIVIAALLVIGLTGITMNPAMSARVMRAGGSGMLVNTVHTSVITLGVLLGSSIGGRAMDNGYGLTAPLWTGVVLGVFGLVSIAIVKVPRMYRPAPSLRSHE
ncbi:MFS transporter [Paenibacillus wenxiniae]|uniref:MFS transporter n=1 Tax=Paenibacillus wenxiniae TaxID=1636843 RepID=A0ABW4RGD1_9BACL